MNAETEPHYPVVRIVTPETTGRRPFAETVLTRIEVDGQLWPCTGYSVDGGKVDGGFQKVTLTFVADLTIEHSR